MTARMCAKINDCSTYENTLNLSHKQKGKLKLTEILFITYFLKKMQIWKNTLCSYDCGEIDSLDVAGRNTQLYELQENVELSSKTAVSALDQIISCLKSCLEDTPPQIQEQLWSSLLIAASFCNCRLLEPIQMS